MVVLGVRYSKKPKYWKEGMLHSSIAAVPFSGTSQTSGTELSATV